MVSILKCSFEWYSQFSSSLPPPPPLQQSAVLCGLDNIQSLTSDSVSVLSALSAQNVAVVVIYNPLEFERSHNTHSSVHHALTYNKPQNAGPKSNLNLR